MLTGRHYQNAYVTRNLDKAVTGFEARADLRAMMRFDVAVELWTPRGSGTGTQSIAFAWIGDLNVELIQPGAGDALALYRDALPEGDGLAFHHVCHRVDDWDAFMARAAKQDCPIVLKGGTPGLLEFVYLDTRAWLGHYTEYTWAAPERWAQMGGR